MAGSVHVRISRIAASVSLVVALSWAQPARADDYFSGASDPLAFEVDRPRPQRARILIASLFGGAVLFGGIGVLFHLDSRSKSDEVSAKSGRLTGRVYTEEVDDTRRAALRSRTFTIASYSIAGGLLVGTLLAYILTDPGTEKIVVGEEAAAVRRPTLLVAPTADGGVVGGEWSF